LKNVVFGFIKDGRVVAHVHFDRLRDGLQDDLREDNLALGAP
jgi:hypothetical protein